MTTGDVAPPARMQDLFDELVRTRISPALRQRGLRKRGRATWWEHRPGGGWVLLALRNDKWNSAEHVEFWGEAVCWPPGTWEFQCAFGGRDVTDLPFVAANAPLELDSLFPAQAGRAANGWTIEAGVDLEALADAVVAWVDGALERARAACDDVDAALAALVHPEHYRGWGPSFAIAMLLAVAPDHPRLPEIVDGKTQSWSADPRPISLRPILQSWRATVGLPAVDDLPETLAPPTREHDGLREGPSVPPDQPPRRRWWRRRR
jgi:hypothetical protein